MATGLNYYSYDKILSFNAAFNMILGPRGDGKTYGAKKKAVNDAIKKGDMFIYLRRYREELSMSAATFFADIEDLWPDWDFKTGGGNAYMAPVETRDQKKREWTHIGYFIALSRAQQYKSVSFHKVKTIIFDEFVIEKGAVRYITDEPTIVKNFYNTVDRYKDKTRLFMIANAVAITNPHFIEYKIDPNKADEKGFLRMADGFMVIQFIQDGQFTRDVLKTRFGKFIENTDYADYAVGNEFSDNHTALLSDRDPQYIYMCTLETKEAIFSCWISKKGNGWYLDSVRPGNEKVYTIVPERMAEGKILLQYQDKMLQQLRTAFNRDRMRFDQASSRNAFLEIFKR